MSDVNKAARDYLKASGASAISVVAIDGVCTFQAGHKIDPNAVSTHWVREEQAAALVKQARHDAGRAPEAATGTAQPTTSASRSLPTPSRWTGRKPAPKDSTTISAGCVGPAF